MMLQPQGNKIDIDLVMEHLVINVPPTSPVELRSKQ